MPGNATGEGYPLHVQYNMHSETQQLSLIPKHESRKKITDVVKLKRMHQIALCAELALEGEVLSVVRQATE